MLIGFRQGYEELQWGISKLNPIKDRLLWFEADFLKRLYLWHYYLDVDIWYTK